MPPGLATLGLTVTLALTLTLAVTLPLTLTSQAGGDGRQAKKRVSVYLVADKEVGYPQP